MLQESLKLFFIMQLQKKILICPLYSFPLWMPEVNKIREREQPALSTILKYIFSSGNAYNWGIFPKCATIVGAVLACSYLI